MRRIGIALVALLPATGLAQDRQQEMQDRMGGVPPAILKLQSPERVKPPSLEAALTHAGKIAQKAGELVVNLQFHRGRRLAVPAEFATIQAAIDAAKKMDTVVVAPGTYFEQLTMKDGVRLTSDPTGDGADLVPVEGARLQLPRRTLRTILDGSKSKPSRHGMIDFNPGVRRMTMVDGFTIRNLPKQNHHLPGHAHGINVRGASPVILNCYVKDNGSTAIGNHVVYKDQGRPIAERDFRWANVKHYSEAVIYRNVITGNLGLGVGCNHFSMPFIIGNEVFANSDAELGDPPSPGVGAKHGAAPTIIGNYVHSNPGGGILSRVGKPQGRHNIDRRGRPKVLANVVSGNGTFRPGISSAGCGTRKQPVQLNGNTIFGAGAVGIGLSKGSTGILKDNVVVGSTAAGIAIEGAVALKLNGNRVTKAKGPGIIIVAGAEVEEMFDNAADANAGPRFVLRASKIAPPKPRPEKERKEPGGEARPSPHR
ncbi:MAG: right-handed parallel beta-helix repeat-containing protein [Planctomycetota bacterium]|jgi:hypothetical protein